MTATEWHRPTLVKQTLRGTEAQFQFYSNDSTFSFPFYNIDEYYIILYNNFKTYQTEFS